MTSQNQSAFLMHPTSRTTHLGGTPLESGEAGGHIKKATWTHIHTAALDGLGPAVANDQVMAHALAQRVECGLPLVGFLDGARQTKGFTEADLRHASAMGDAVAVHLKTPRSNVKNPEVLGFVGDFVNLVIGHGSGPLLLCGAALGLFLPCAGGINPIRNPRRKLVGPLLYRLVGDANCLGGCGDGPAQQFDGLCFLHSHIEP